jgi:hypothetical protein
MGAPTSAEAVSLIRTQPKMPSPYCRNPAMEDTSFRVLPPPNLGVNEALWRVEWASSVAISNSDGSARAKLWLFGARDFDFPILQAPRPARSRADETLEMWTEIGNKLIAMAQEFPEECRSGFAPAISPLKVIDCNSRVVVNPELMA